MQHLKQLHEREPPTETVPDEDNNDTSAEAQQEEHTPSRWIGMLHRAQSYVRRKAQLLRDKRHSRKLKRRACNRHTDLLRQQSRAAAARAAKMKRAADRAQASALETAQLLDTYAARLGRGQFGPVLADMQSTHPALALKLSLIHI